MRRRALAFVLCVFAMPVWGDALSQRLVEVLQTPRLLEQLSLEAERSADDVNRDFLGGEGGPVYADTVARLNDPARLVPIIEETLAKELSEDDRKLVISFFESELGQNIIQLELSARSTIFDPAVEQAVRAHVAEEGVSPIVADMIVQGDLIERNVTDAMEVLRQFYLGRIAGGALDLPAADIESFVEANRDSVRFETQQWLEAYMTLAYSPLSDDDLQTYAEFWKTEAGSAFDRALFAAYLRVFVENSFALGQIVGRLEASDEI